MSINYTLDNGELVISGSSPEFRGWRGKPLGYPIENILVDSSKSNCIVLLSREHGPKLYSGGPPKAFRNLICINNQGELLWIADLPRSGRDMFTKIVWAKDFPIQVFITKPDIREGSIVAFSMSGFLVDIDPETGRTFSTLLIK